MTYTWTDNATEVGVATCNPDVLNENLMHLKYENKPQTIYFGTSSTTSTTSEKAVTATGFTLTKGSMLSVVFSNTNTCLPIIGNDLQVSFGAGNAIDDFGLYTPTTIGSPTYTNNKFNSNGTTGLAYFLPSMGSSSWIIKCGLFKLTTASALYCLCDTTTFGVRLVRNASNRLQVYLSSNGTSYDIANGTAGTGLLWNSTSTEYYIRIRFTGTQYLVEYSTDDITYTTEITVNSTSIINPNLGSIYYGINNASANPIVGTMDNIGYTIGSSTFITKTNSLSLNVNSLGAKTVYHEDGNAVSGNRLALCPANYKINFIYDGTNFILQKRVLENYNSAYSWYRKWSDGYIEQGSQTSGTAAGYTVNFVTNFVSNPFNFHAQEISGGAVYASTCSGVTNSYMTIAHPSSGGTQVHKWSAFGY